MANRIDLRLLRYFVATAEQSNLSRASELLNLAQPALSRQIRVLEEEVGLDLFQRLPRGVRLTPGGERLLVHAREILDRVQLMQEDMRNAASGDVAILNIGLNPVALDTKRIGHLLDVHLVENPRVQLKLHGCRSSEQVRRLFEFEQDIGFLFLEQPDPALAVALLDEQKLLLGMHVEHPLAARDQIRIDDLRPFGFIQPNAFVSEALQQLLQAHDFEPTVVQETNDTRLLLQLLSVGRGLAFVNSAWTQSCGPRIAIREVEDLNFPLPLYLCRRKCETRREVLRFFDFIVEHSTTGLSAADHGGPMQLTPHTVGLNS